MAENKLMFYRGFPLIRSGNTIFYGSGGDDFAAKLTIKDTKKIADLDVLAGGIGGESFACVLEPHFEEVAELQLQYTSQHVVVLQLAAALTVVYRNLAALFVGGRRTTPVAVEVFRFKVLVVHCIILLCSPIIPVHKACQSGRRT